MAITKEGVVKVRGEVDTKPFEAFASSIKNIEKGFTAMGKAMLDIKTDIIKGAFNQLKDSAKAFVDESMKWGHVSDTNMAKVNALADATKGLLDEENAWRGLKKLQQGDLKLTQQQMESLAKASVQYARVNNEEVSESFDKLVNAAAGGKGAQQALYQMGIQVKLTGEKSEQAAQFISLLNAKFHDVDIALKSGKEKMIGLQDAYSDFIRETSLAITKSDEFQWALKYLGQGFDLLSGKMSASFGYLKQGTSEYFEFMAKKVVLEEEDDKKRHQRYLAYKNLAAKYRQDEARAKQDAEKSALMANYGKFVSEGDWAGLYGIPKEIKKNKTKRQRDDFDAVKWREDNDEEQRRLDKQAYEMAKAIREKRSGAWMGDAASKIAEMSKPSALSFGDATQAGVDSNRISSIQQTISLESERLALQDRQIQSQLRYNNALANTNRTQQEYNAYQEQGGYLAASLKDGLIGLAGGMWQAADAAIIGGGGMGKAILQMTKSMLLGVAQQATVKAIFETAEGIALASNPFTAWMAPPHFVAAKMYAVAAITAGGIGLGLSAASSGSSAGSPSSPAKTNSDGYRPTFGSKGSDQQQQVVVQVYFDRSDPAAEQFATRQIKARLAA